MRIIGITGTLGAGKGTIVDYLVKHEGFEHFSVRGYLTEEINKRGIPVNRDSMVALGNELRAQNSPSFIVEQLFEQASKSGADCIIESIRTIGEVQALKRKGGFWLFAVDADPRTRYERVIERSSETDHVSFEKFWADEAREMESNDPNKQNLLGCINLADYTIENNGSLEDLNQKVKKIINELNSN